MKATEELLSTAQVEGSRLRLLPAQERSEGGDYILYWMQKAQRSQDNPALDLAIHLANVLHLPLVCVFVLCEYPHAQPLHYRFMLEGLLSCAEDLRSRGIAFALVKGNPVEEVLELARQAAVLVADEGKLSFERKWRDNIVAQPGRPDMVIVETESVVPPLVASDHLEWSAATLRKKIAARLPFFLPQLEDPRKETCKKIFRGSLGDDRLFACSSFITSPSPTPSSKSRFGALSRLQRLGIQAGQDEALKRFKAFVETGGLEKYNRLRNDPNSGAESGMSPYLHFGQVSPSRLARMALDHSAQAAQAYVEQLVVRRELALNYLLFNPEYLVYKVAVPDWAQRSLASRNPLSDAYTDMELETGCTADPYWNAAQKELVLKGKMHNYMRMYWGKQLLTWFRDPAKAFDTAILLNDFYSLDGRDPNGYAGVAWCFGRHDRPWPERKGFGTVRAMMPSGLKRKFDADRYAEEMELLYNERIKETS